MKKLKFILYFDNQRELAMSYLAWHKFIDNRPSLDRYSHENSAKNHKYLYIFSISLSKQ